MLAIPGLPLLSPVWLIQRFACFLVEFESPHHSETVELIADLMQKYNAVHCYIDASQPSLISSLKSSIGEEPKYQEAFARYKSQHVNYELFTKVLPVNFSTDHKQLLAHTRLLMSDGVITIDRRFDKLVNSLNTASDIENSLQKQSMSNSDSLDSLRLASSLYEYS